MFNRYILWSIVIIGLCGCGSSSSDTASVDVVAVTDSTGGNGDTGAAGDSDNNGDTGGSDNAGAEVDVKATYISQCELLKPEHSFTLRVVSTEKALAGGMICSGSLVAFNNMLLAYPAIKEISITEMYGSLDNQATINISSLLHDNGIVTPLASDSVIASGAVSFFLGGNLRDIQLGAKIGVRSWKAAAGQGGSDLPKDAPEHDTYLNFYKKVGISEDFYWFTLGAKPNGSTGDDDIHWMTEAEINQYGLAI